ncbi:MAG: hypothetical protein R3F11_17665 [Verrucomicrobiales bacterium]
MRKDYRRFTLPLDKISEEDQAYVVEQIKMAEEAAAAAAEAKVEPASGIYADAVEKRMGKAQGPRHRLQFFGPKRGQRKAAPRHLPPRQEQRRAHARRTLPRRQRIRQGGQLQRTPVLLCSSRKCPDSDKGWNGEIKDNVSAIIEDMQKNLPVDKDRIYLIGYSMCLRYVPIPRRRAETFAAAVPIARMGAACPPRKNSRKSRLWIFHGEKDPTVPVEQSQDARGA